MVSIAPIPTPVRQGTLPPDELGVLLYAMKRGTPWRDALRDLELPVLSAKPDWFTNESKAAFYMMLRTPTEGLALDLGAGSGVIAGALSRRFRNVMAIERDPRWCEFMRRRFAEDGAGVEVINGSALAIPRQVADADLVVVNGVLEWVGHSDDPAVHHRSPHAVQLEFLRGIHRALRKGGRIGIAIENRYHYENFRGAMPHGELPYAAVLPRAIADLMTRLKLGEPYRTWIYGTAGYRRLLNAAGFSRVEIHAALPTYHRPVAVVSLRESRRIRGYLAEHSNAKALLLDALTRVGLIGYFVHSFYISAERA
jgi:SAM-dependent methyltransferase